ncbi:MAG: glycosyltransferase, partial [Nanoarchaeota archaeon]
MARVDLSIIMPAFNEGDALKVTLPELHNYLKSLPYSFELIVGDDGSTDDTKQVVTAFAKKHKNVRYVGYPVNKGKGHALSIAFA